jgi:hypothetical protein
MSPPCSGSKNKPDFTLIPCFVCSSIPNMELTCFSRNVGWLSTNYMTFYPRIHKSSQYILFIILYLGTKWGKQEMSQAGLIMTDAIKCSDCLHTLYWATYEIMFHVDIHRHVLQKPPNLKTNQSSNSDDLWNVIVCSPVQVRRGFGTNSCFHLQGRRYMLNKQRARDEFSACCPILAEHIFHLEDGGSKFLTTRRKIPEYSTLHSHRCENLENKVVPVLN